MVILFISHVHFLREALIEVLRGDEGIMAFGAFSRETTEAVTGEFTPDLVVIDSSHPDAMALVTMVRKHLPKVGVVVLATRERDEDFLLWADIGISGYLGPDTSSRDLIATVRRAGAGEVVCPPRLTALLLNRFADRSNDRTTRAGIHALTPREREIVELLADGLPNKLIARRLHVALPPGRGCRPIPPQGPGDGGEQQPVHGRAAHTGSADWVACPSQRPFIVRYHSPGGVADGLQSRAEKRQKADARLWRAVCQARRRRERPVLLQAALRVASWPLRPAPGA